MVEQFLLHHSRRLSWVFFLEIRNLGWLAGSARWLALSCPWGILFRIWGLHPLVYKLRGLETLQLWHSRAPWFEVPSYNTRSRPPSMAKRGLVIYNDERGKVMSHPDYPDRSSPCLVRWLKNLLPGAPVPCPWAALINPFSSVAAKSPFPEPTLQGWRAEFQWPERGNLMSLKVLCKWEEAPYKRVLSWPLGLLSRSLVYQVRISSGFVSVFVWQRDKHAVGARVWLISYKFWCRQNYIKK